MEDIAKSDGGCSQHAARYREKGSTYEVSRRFESAAFRSFTCAFCVARNCIFS